MILSALIASISQVIICIWIIGMAVAVKHYNFLSISPEDVSEEILGSIAEAIADRLAGNSTNLEIAENLKISEQTVKNHITAIYRKAGVPNRMEFLTFFNKNKKTPPA